MSRPGGVVAIAVLFILGAVFGFLAGIGIWLLGTSMYTGGYTSTMIWYYYLANPAVSPSMKGAIVGLMLPQSQSSMAVGTWMQYFGLFIIISSVIYLISAGGLLGMKNWGRYLAILIGIVDILFGIIAIIGGFILGFGLLTIIYGILDLIFGIVVVAYLLGEVKHEFG